MSKQNKLKRLQTPPAARGRTAQTVVDEVRPTKGAVEIEKRTEASRPIGNGGGKNRGDRRDTSRLYTNNAKHSSRGSDLRPDVKTRAR